MLVGRAEISGGSACALLAAGAAMLANPWAVSAIAAAFASLDAALVVRSDPSECGYARALEFNWDGSDGLHASVFQQAPESRLW